MSVPIDTIEQIRELQAEGFGRTNIGFITGVYAETVYNVMKGKEVDTCDVMTPRQRHKLMTRWHRANEG